VKSFLQPVADNQIFLRKMASNKFEGWRILLNDAPCGFIKFIPKVDDLFKQHVTINMSVRKAEQGKHIGRIALKKAIESSQHLLFVAHLRKSNIPSFKVLCAVGFQTVLYPNSRQLCMIFKKL
jgi:hypothetical protein